MESLPDWVLLNGLAALGAAFAFCMGACAGSFINVVAVRWPEGMSVVAPPSRGSPLLVTLNVSFPRLPCALIDLEVTDVLGTRAGEGDGEAASASGDEIVDISRVALDPSLQRN
jgi:hypothetical protein